MKISLIPAVTYVESSALQGRNVVIIDVLRATSVITTALENGAAEIWATEEVAEALQHKEQDCLLGGERKALKIEGFHLSNSPLEYTRERVAGKRIILTTTNGTKAIRRSALGNRVFIGCMRNGKAIARKLTRLAADSVIVCSGTNGNFSLDDFFCAGKIIHDALEFCHIEMDDFAAAAYMAYKHNRHDPLSYIRLAAHYNYLISIGLEEDIKFCFTEDTTGLVPEFRDGKIVVSQN